MKHRFAQQLLKQGIAACKAGQFTDARRLLLQVLELDPDNEVAWLWLSGVVDSTSERKHCLEQVLRLNPDNTHARAGLAWLERQVADTAIPEPESPSPTDSWGSSPQETISDNRCPLCNKPVSAQSLTCHHCHRDLVVMCPTCETQVDLEETVCGVCESRLGDYRQGAAYYAALGDAYLANQKADLATKAWQNVLELDHNYADAHLRLGEAQTISGDYEAAHTNFEKAIGQTANPASAHLALGRIHERRHHWDAAKNAYAQAVATDETLAGAQFALGRLLIEEKALQEAFPHIRRATELDPKNDGAWFLLGQLYEMAQEPRKAIQTYERAHSLTEQASTHDSEWTKRAFERLEILRPSLPPSVALNWPEAIRQTSSMALVPAMAAVVNGGLRPWQISPEDYVGVLVATLGAYFWVSASTLPRNPGMRAMLGQGGLSQPRLRAIIGVLGGLFWSIGLLFVLLAPVLI